MSRVRQFDTTYRIIREKLINGAWPPGMQLVTPKVASDLGVSQSPVRECLNHLAGENMVDFWPTMGFFVPKLSAAALRDLFDCHFCVLRWIVDNDLRNGVRLEVSGSEHADSTASLFREIARRMGNDALLKIVENLGDRLHVYRRFDPMIFPRANNELSALATALSINPTPSITRDLLKRYHISRKIEAERYVELRAEQSDVAI